MRSIAMLLVLLFVACAFGQPSTFDTKIAAHWSLPCTSTSSLYATLPYNDPSACRLNPAEQAASYLSTPVSVTWGVGVYGPAYASTLTFDAYDAVTLKLSTGNVAQDAVPIGVLTHFNFPINCYDDCNKYIPTNFVLGLYVNVQVGSDKATYKGDFTMFLDETPNVDGRNPLSAPCSYPKHEISWDTFTGGVGYTSDFPCCPYYTAKALPSGAISLNGPCSDRLKFTTTANFNEFVIQGTKYTLVIAGFSSSNTVFNADVTFFTSQENQSQQAYIWAYISRKCTDSSACNDNQQCTTNVCNTNTGLCEYTPVANGLSCTDPKTTYYTDVCTKFKCKTGTCFGSLLPEDGSCVNSAARPTGKTTDCSRSVCKSGFCTWSNWRTGSSCTTGPAFTDQQCQRKTCNLGSCRLGSGNTGNPCTPASPDAQAALAAATACNSATCVASSSGTCKFSTVLGGSCSQGVSQAVCNRRLCKSKVVNSLTVGTCRGSAVGVSGSCTATGPFAGTPSAVLCKRRLCTNKNGVGSCQVSNHADGGSCASGNGAITTAVECKARTCKAGTCNYTPNNNQGSCTNAALTLAQCWKRSCNLGTCGLTINTVQGSCTGPTPVECKKRACNSGVCELQTNTQQGSCTGAGLTKKECFRLVCSSGVCSSLVNPNQGSCINTGVTKQQCQKLVCNTANGNCELQVNTNQGSCTGPTPAECKLRACSNGVCQLQNNANQGSCTGPAPAECKRRVCNAGACESQANTQQGSCTNGALTKKECFRIFCNNGNCESQVNPNQVSGSCTGPAWKECHRRTCNSGGTCKSNPTDVQGSCYSLTARYCWRRLCNAVTAGVCGTVATVRGGSCSGAGLTAVECKRRVCNGAGVCTGSATNNGGSCTAVLTTRRSCYRRACNSGTCNYTPNSNQGSCTVTALGVAVPWISCRRRTCSAAGSCAYSFNDLQGSCQFTGAGVAVAAVVCKKRGCSSGSCILSNNDVQGSCVIDGAGAAVAAVACKRRTCSGGVCTSVNNDAQGSCLVDGAGNAVSSRDCKRRTCSNGACIYTDNTSGGGSCTSTWTTAGVQTAVAVTFCNRRACDTRGTCKYLANTAETAGSCRTLAFRECYRRVCRSTTKNPPGSCGYSGVTSGSCTGVATAECKIRQCQSDSTCNYNAVGNGGSCTGAYDSSSYAGMSASCTRRVCNNGACSLTTNNIGGTCNTGKTSNDYTCFKQRCRGKSGVSGGTCSTSASPTTKSCNAGNTYSNNECRVARCDGTGSCRYNYNGVSTVCTTLANKVCAPERCNGQGTCIYRGDIKEGDTGCLAVDATTTYCTTSQCQSGECVDTSNVNANNASTICKTSSAGEDTCKNYYCIYKNPTSTSNKLGTCVRLKDPSQVNQKCSSSAYTGASTEDARCFALLCDNNGVCQKQPRADGTFCATPPNTETNNGYGCSQYVCRAGTCNTAAAVPIKNGTNCAGWLPCDPSTAGCLAECQRFICYNGICQVDYYKENQNCTYIKYLTARAEDGSLVEEEARDSENGGITANECTQGKCYQGRCVAVTVKNGTACGNRTKYNDLCYNDYCNAQGRCVNTGRRNCQGVLPLPSVCWDVTCEASSGDCVLRANGVVDCSCIFDCSACTANLQSGGRKLSCWWCTGDGKNAKAGCFNRRLPGQTGEETPPPQGRGKCYKDSSPCAGDNGLSGGQIAGIVVGILGLTSLALLVIALLILAIRYFAAPAAPPANASLTDLAFDKNVKNNVFYKGANLEMFSSVYAEPKFITT